MHGLSINSGGKKYIDGACVLADKDGDKIFSTFDTRDVDKSQADMSCGTHIITGGTGKYAGITGSEPFACDPMPALAGEGGYTAMDIPHKTRAAKIEKLVRAAGSGSRCRPEPKGGRREPCHGWRGADKRSFAELSRVVGLLL